MDKFNRVVSIMNNLNLPDGLYMRPSRDSDKPFIASLSNSTRNALRIIDAEQGYVEHLMDM